MRTEKPDWWKTDETAVNGIAIKYCNPKNWWEQQKSDVWMGHLGDWGLWTMCDEGKFINAMSVKMDPEHAVDDTALNGVKIQCDYIDHTKTQHHEVDNGAKWGDWQGWSRSMRQKFVCGA